MTDIAGLNLNEPAQTNWDNYNPGSTYVAPPPALGPDGKPIVYVGQAPKEFVFESTGDDNLLQVLLDPVTIVQGDAKGYTLRFTRANVRKFKNKAGEEIEAHTLGNYLKACGSTAKPQRNAEYIAAVKQTAGRTFSFTVDWEARNKDTGEQIRGYKNFPDDPERPGQKKSILKPGDTYIDQDGNQQTVKSDVLFANARVRYFRNPKK